MLQMEMVLRMIMILRMEMMLRGPLPSPIRSCRIALQISSLGEATAGKCEKSSPLAGRQCGNGPGNAPVTGPGRTPRTC